MPASRLGVTRALVIQPTVLLMDEPTSALDPLATEVIEHLIARLKKEYTIVIVSHNTQLAGRVSNETGMALFYLGKLIEVDKINDLGDHPREGKTHSHNPTSIHCCLLSK